MKNIKYELDINYFPHTSNFKGNWADANKLNWICPKCNTQNCISDAWELIENDCIDVDVECDNCDKKYKLEVVGQSEWEPTDMILYEEVKS